MNGLTDWQMKINIKAERQKYEAEDVQPNKDMHARILATWERDSPQMFTRLSRLGIADDLAFVCQERMWRQATAYRNGGMYFTDAREQAEREHLLLEPEEPILEPPEDMAFLPPGSF